MKRMILTLAMVFILGLFLAFSAQAADSWKTSNQVSIAWDPVTALTDGSPLPAGDVIKFDLFVRPDGDTGAGTKVTPTPIASTTGIIVFGAEGRWRVGVNALRYNAAGELLATSTTAWSSDVAACQGGNTFGVIFFVAPAGVKNLNTP